MRGRPTSGGIDDTSGPSGRHADCELRPLIHSAIVTRITHSAPGLTSADTLTDGTTNKAYTATERTKLSGIATGATANATDAQLRDRSTHTGTQLAATVSDFDTAADARITAQKGVASGLASLDVSGKVPSAQLPAYVDDVLEYANLAAFPGTGTTGIIYVAIDTSKTYRSQL